MIIVEIRYRNISYHFYQNKENMGALNNLTHLCLIHGSNSWKFVTIKEVLPSKFVWISKSFGSLGVKIRGDPEPY